jgi:RsmE family RNA methyltransferase
MNLILFEAEFEAICIEGTDTRAQHLRKVLRAEVGTLVFVGFVNGPRGRAKVVELGADGSVSLELLGTEPAPQPLPITVLMGLPRPHTAKRVLFEAASLGVARLHFFEAERGEPSYARSSLWQEDAWRQRLWLGAEQSFGTHLPDVAMYPDLQTALSELYTISARVALDNYEASAALSDSLPSAADASAIALGPERGWSPNERDCLRQNGWKLAHLGPQVLRAETALVAAVAATASRLGYWQGQTETGLSSPLPEQL